MFKVILCIAVAFFALPLRAETMSLGYSERAKGTSLVRTYTAAMEAQLWDIDLRAGYSALEKPTDGDLKLSLAIDGLRLDYARGGLLPESWGLTLDRQLGGGNLHFAYSQQEGIAAAPGVRNLDLTWQAKW